MATKIEELLEAGWDPSILTKFCYQPPKEEPCSPVILQQTSTEKRPSQEQPADEIIDIKPKRRRKETDNVETSTRSRRCLEEPPAEENIDVKPKKRSKRDEKDLGLSSRAYNLRQRRSLRGKSLDPALGLYFEDKLECYHAALKLSDDALKLLHLTRNSVRSQLQSFTSNHTKFFAKTWLTIVRIFEYDAVLHRYNEIKRIPQRYFEIAPNIITSIHHTDQNFYIGYLLEKSRDLTLVEKVSYLEIRDLNGELKSKRPYYYDQVISSIDSRGDFIYVSLVNCTFCIHHKRNFYFRVFRVDMQALVPNNELRLINLSAKSLHTSNITSLQITTSTSSSLIISHFNALSHTIWQNFNFHEADGIEAMYSTESTHFLKDLILIRRKLKDKHTDELPKCRLIVGRLCKSSTTKKHDYFIQEATVCLMYDIHQSEPDSDNKLFLLGSVQNENGLRQFEIGCIQIKELKPIWVRSLKNVDTDSKILVHTDHIVIVRNCQSDECIRFDKVSNNCPTCDVKILDQDSGDHDSHSGILKNFKILRNRCLIGHTTQ